MSAILSDVMDNPRLTSVSSPVGDLWLFAERFGGEDVLAGLWFDQPSRLPDVSGFSFQDASRVPLFAEIQARLLAYFAGSVGIFDDTSDIPMRLKGTELQRQVWQELRSVPAGETLSYGELAARVGRPKAARPVGQAVGRNPISILIPCHRVVGADGSLTGYGGGLDRKIELLTREGVLL